MLLPFAFFFYLILELSQIFYLSFMEIKKEQSGEKIIFYIEEGNVRIAEIFNHLRGTDRIIIEHTEVSDSLRGKGVGKKMVDHVVAYAREHQLKIVPMCSFARSVFERFKDKYVDVL